MKRQDGPGQNPYTVPLVSPSRLVGIAMSHSADLISFHRESDERGQGSSIVFCAAEPVLNFSSAIFQALQKDNLDILYAGLLIGRYLLLTRRAAEGYTPLTIALQVRPSKALIERPPSLRIVPRVNLVARSVP